jgi:THO complex subunit 3
MPTAASKGPLSKSTLPIALQSAKTQIYTDIPTPAPSNTRGLRNAPPPTSAAATSQIRTLAWSPLGNLIATADARTLRVWNPERPAVKNSTELKPPPAAVTNVTTTNGTVTKPPASQAGPLHLTGTERVAWNPVREAELSSVGNDGIVRFWDVRTRGQCVGEVKVGGEGFSMAWRKGGDELVVGRKVSLTYMGSM